MRTYPRIVSAMLIKTSAPQPATMKTPTGGTGVVSMVVWVWRWCERTEDCDEDEENCFDHVDGLKLLCVGELIAVCLMLIIIS